MRCALLLGLLTVSSAFAQDTNPVTSRTYQLSGPTPSTGNYLAEMTTVIRVVADARDVSVDAPARQITFAGRGEIPEMSEWLLKQLDRAPEAKPSEPQVFHSTGKDDNVAVFYLAHASDQRELQEILTILRTVGDVQKVFAYRALNALAMRGPAAEIALVKWMIESVDRNKGAGGAQFTEFHIEGVRDPVVRVYYLANAKGEDLSRIITAVRTTGGIMKTFVDSEKSTLVVRSFPEYTDKAEAIVLAMDQQLAR